MEGRVESKAPDQRALIEGDDHKKPDKVPQPSYPGVPFASTGSADADSFVHHIDGDKSNDEAENLRVFPSESEHQRFHGIMRGGIQQPKEASA